MQYVVIAVVGGGMRAAVGGGTQVGCCEEGMA
jgi:hypothetical protein